jgi:putative GTP pyrophosphokinase
VKLKPTAFADDLWSSQPHIIRRFIESRSNYEKLAEEVAYILESKVSKARIEYAAVTCRAKTLASFCEKVVRKKYQDPLKEVTDLAGVRIVYLYASDLSHIESVIEGEFRILEKVAKVEEEGTDRFGYGALHYLITLGKKASGARYDDLKDMVCEIQVRTILQDAWALVAHHLSYKKEADIPKKLRRKLYALSGLFETADDQFDRLKIERAEYAKNVERSLSAASPGFLAQEINLDNLHEYLRWRFPDRERSSRYHVAGLLNDLQKSGYRTLGEIQKLLKRTEEAVKALETKYPPSDEETGEEGPYTPVGAVRVAINFVDERRRGAITQPTIKHEYDEFMYLVKSEAAAQQTAARRRPTPRA